PSRLWISCQQVLKPDLLIEIAGDSEPVGGKFCDYRRLSMNEFDPERGFMICEVVRDGDGTVSDWRCLDANPTIGVHTGVDRVALAGRLRSDVLAGLDDWWLRIADRVVHRKRSEHVTHYNNMMDRLQEITVVPLGPEQVVFIFSRAVHKCNGQ